jgi:hypothetical protein
MQNQYVGRASDPTKFGSNMEYVQESEMFGNTGYLRESTESPD